MPFPLMHLRLRREGEEDYGRVGWGYKVIKINYSFEGSDRGPFKGVCT